MGMCRICRKSVKEEYAKIIIQENPGMNEYVCSNCFKEVDEFIEEQWIKLVNKRRKLRAEKEVTN